MKLISSKVDDKCLHFINNSAISVVVSDVAARASIGTAYDNVKSSIVKVGK